MHKTSTTLDMHDSYNVYSHSSLLSFIMFIAVLHAVCLNT